MLYRGAMKNKNGEQGRMRGGSNPAPPTSVLPEGGHPWGEGASFNITLNFISLTQAVYILYIALQCIALTQ